MAGQRVNLYLPDELAAAVRDQLPGVNLSALLQEQLRARLACSHELVACVRCTAQIEASELARGPLWAFWREIAAAVEPIVFRVGTATGTAAAAWGVARAHGIPVGPNPRPTRSERETAADRAWEQDREAS